MKTNAKGLLLKLSILVVSTFLGLVCLEAGATFIWNKKYDQWLENLSMDSTALSLAYPIASTNNLYAYPLLTRKYNDAMKQYARTHQLPVIDFESYALDNLRPRSRYWSDSVHLTNDGYLRMGKYLADELRRFIPSG